MPVLVVSGFLGSGKTTLVRRILADAQAHGVRTAVVSNEFGELGIDEALLGGDRAEFVELAGGCVCCRLSDELVETLQRLEDTVHPDRIVIETSGVALPFDTQLNLYRPPVDAWVGDEACVVVVNAAQVAAGEELADPFVTQVESADLLVLNKTDLVPDLDAVEARVRVHNPDAPLLRAAFGDVPPELLFPTGPRARRAEAPPHTHADFESAELAVPDGLPAAEAEAWIFARRGYRTKGFVRCAEGVRIVQGVGRRFELTEPGGLVVAPDLLNRVVVIRRGQGHGHPHDDRD